MLPEHYSYAHALAGGVLIGLGTLFASVATGVPPGISGVVSEILKREKGEVAWRVLFLAGLIAGAVMAFCLLPASDTFRSIRSLPVLTFAGVLVGLGTRVGGGCTSGHGVCGIGLGSKRGIVGTLVFMATAMLTVFVVDHLLGGTAS
jgi:uncharacterized membrane protein YedE/YeeE